jgi:DNA repair exonuclease SbcCD ATPase subunit
VYIGDLVAEIARMRTKSEELKYSMQQFISDQAKVEQQNQLLSENDPELANNLAKVEKKLNDIRQRKTELEQEREMIASEISDLDARMQVASDALKEKIHTRENLVRNITPEKREGSPAHWRMFYEELCTWYHPSWDCKFDATNVFQWVVDPTPIKALYLEATNEIEEMKRVNEERIARSIDLLERRKENTKMIIDFAKQAGDLLHLISENPGPLKRSGASISIYKLIIAKLDQVGQTFAEISTAFKEWQLSIQTLTNKQDDVVDNLAKLEPSRGNERIATKVHSKSLKYMSETLLDCATKSGEAWKAMEDIEFYRTFYMTQVVTMDTAEIKEFIDNGDVANIQDTIKDYYRQENVIATAKGIQANS